MRHPWAALVWHCLSAEMKARILYTEQLAADLFVSLPASTKRSFIRQAQSVLRYPTFIETGTFRGDMSLYASGLFCTVHTVELSPELATQARSRFAAVHNVAVHQGDSASVLRYLLPTIDTSCVFWLDGHYSGGVTARGETDTPILEELAAILAHSIRPHAILIDDARVFGTDEAYPTLEAVIAGLREIDPAFRIGVSSDIIWAAPTKLLDFRWRLVSSGAVVPPSTIRGTRARAA